MTAELATVEVRHDGSACVVGISGEVDLSNAAAIETRVLSETADSQAVVLDLTGVRFIDSSGVRVLDHVVTAYEGVRPVLIAAADGGAVHTTLRILGFDETLLATSAEAALATLTDV